MLRTRLKWGLVLAAALSAAAPSFTQGPGGLSNDLDEAEKRLDADIKACRPINVEDYKSLNNRAMDNLKFAAKAGMAGAPINAHQVAVDADRSDKLLQRAKEAAANSKPCPPPQQAPQAAPPKPAGTPPPVQLGVPQVKDPFKKLEDDADDALDELDDAMDDCDEAKVQALIPELEQLAQQAHDVADTAAAAGKLSRIDPAEAATLASDLDKAIAAAKKFKCIKKTSYYRYAPPELGGFQQQLLAMHNQERKLVYARPLKWDFKLEWHATGYAHQLSLTGDLEHAPREGRGIERENLSKTLIGWSPSQMISPWIAEKSDFVPGYFPNVARDGNSTRVLHYTQMIWPTTLYLGCGYVEGGGYGWLVCRYSPGGNRDGESVGPLFQQQRG